MSATVVMFQPWWIFFICVHNVCVGLLCDLCFNIRGVCTDLDVCFVPWWNMPSVRAPNMHILKSSRRELFISYPRPQNCSFTPEMAQNKWSSVFAETVGFVFVYNKGGGIHRPQTFFIDSMSAEHFCGCNVNYSEFKHAFVFELFMFWIKSIVDFFFLE